MEKYIELLEEWVSDDRRLRNNRLESDFDKFCEEKNVAIEALINRVKELEESEQYLYDAYQDAGKKMFEYSEKLEKLANRIKEKIEEVDKMMEKINQGELQNYTVGELLSFKAIYKDLLEDK